MHIVLFYKIKKLNIFFLII